MPKIIPAAEQRGSQRGPGKVLHVKGSKKKHGHGGVVGLAENLAKDVGEAIVGLPMGVKEIAIDPALKLAHGDVRGAAHELAQPVKAVGKSYAQMYGPLTHGDVSRFLHNLYEHPLGPILDLATVLTLGGAAAGTVSARTAATLGQTGRLARLGQPGQITLRSARAIAEGEGPTATRLTSRNPVTRQLPHAIDRMLKRLPADTRHVGEIARWAREAERLPRQKALARRHQMNAYNRVTRKLSKEETAALHLIARGVSPRDWKRYLETEGTVGEHTLKVLDNPKIQELWHKPSERMLSAHTEAVKLSKLDAELKTAHGLLSPETAAGRLDFHRGLVEEKIGPIERPSLEPFYVPDRAVAERVANSDFERMGGGFGVPRNPVKQNRGILFKTGQLALQADLLGPEFLRTVKYALFDDIHNELLSGGVRISGPLPQGMVYIRRRTRRGRVVERGPGNPERIAYTQRIGGEHIRGLEDLIPDPEDVSESTFAREGMTTTDAADADTHLGYRIAVPKSLADQVAGEFAKSSRAVKLLFEQPTSIWRALTLGYRVGFLTNNVVGNHLLLALRFAGLNGLRAYLHALGRTKGIGAVKRLLLHKDTPRDENWQQLMMEFFPEQVAGTFGETQAVRGSVSPRVRRGLRHAKAGIIPATQAASEGFLRDVGVEAALRSNPVVKATARKLRGQTKDFHAVARKALESDPHLAREVSDKVNAALGDYTSLSPFERRAVRQLFPFWAWYRAIATIAGKMAVETPGRTALLARLDEIESEAVTDQVGELPDFLRGLIPLGPGANGTERVFTTGGVNPFGTIRELGQAAGSLTTGQPGEAGQQLLPLMNPFLQGLIEQATGQSTFGGKAQPTRLPGIAAVLERIATNTPQAQLTRGPSRMYPNRDLRAQLLAFLGAPVKDLNLAEARRRALQDQRR